MIVVVLFIWRIVLGIIKESKKIEYSEKFIIILLLYNKDFAKSLVTVTRLIQITVEFQFHYFVLILIIIDTFHHASIMASIPSERFYNNNWLKIHQNHCFQVKQENNNSIIIGDSIVAGLTQILTFGIIFLVTDSSIMALRSCRKCSLAC